MDEKNETSTPSQAQTQKKSIGKEIFEWFYTLAIAVIIAMLIKGFLFDVVRVDGKSMYPTLDNNDRLIITKLGYEPHQGDIIILDSTYKKRTEYFDNLEQTSNTEIGTIKRKFMEFSLPEDLKKRYFVKRIIALPGQTVDLVDGKVYIDGELYNEEYYSGETFSIDPAAKYPLTVQENTVFVMGDNRAHSKDSRSTDLGLVPYDAIVGKSQLRIFPFNNMGLTK